MITVSHHPAWPEGTQILNTAGAGSTRGVYLFEYDANNIFLQAPNARPIFVNVANATDIVNISLCGWNTADTMGIEMFRTSGSPSFSTGTELNYATFVVAGSPGSNTGGTTGQWSLSTRNARTATQTTICNDAAKPNTPTGALTTPVRFRVPAAGTYEIRLHNDSQVNTSANAVFSFFDITVTPNSTTNPLPGTANGQVWSRAWAFNAGNSFANEGAYDAEFYVRTPGGRPNTEFRWELDLNRFAPQRHEIVANGIGMNPPNSRYSVASGSYQRDFPIYLAYPASTPLLPLLPEPVAPNILGFRFIDSDGQDSTITPNPATANVQDSGDFEFSTDVNGTYKLTIDTNKDGVFGLGDKLFFGPIAANTLTQETWNGTDANGTQLPVGTYPVQLQIRIGEYHFVTFDAETSGGTPSMTGSSGGNGLSIWKSMGPSSRQAVQVYWDDQTFLSDQGGTSNLPNGGLSGTANGSHTWGNFASGSIGDSRFMDTWVFGADQQLVEAAIIADIDQNDFGDAPDSYGTDKTNTAGEGVGASQLLSNTIRLGTVATDEELPNKNGQPNATANGDDANGTDDEDSVVSFAPLADTATAYTVGLQVQNTSGANAYLGGWIDFNRNGQFSAGEGVVQTIPTGTNGNINLNWTGLTGLVAGNTYARFRINNDLITVNSFVGGGRNGEIEDYSLTIRGANSPLDYGDAPDSETGTGSGNYTTTQADGGASHLLRSNLRLGANAADADAGTLQNTDASADDDDQSPDDEDGVTFPNALAVDSTNYSATVTVTNTTGTPATLVGWIDFNKNGVFEPTEGQTTTIADNVTDSNTPLNWTGLSGLTGGDTYARFRLSNGTITTATPTGSIGSGEVEDYKITVTTKSPNVLLVKRITAVNASTTTNMGQDLAVYYDEPSNPYDDNDRTVAAPSNPGDPPADTIHWPTLATFMPGGVDGGLIEPGGELEYTIYFLSDGDVDAQNVLVCDYMPTHLTFVSNAFNSGPVPDPAGLSSGDRGILYRQGANTFSVTNAADGDGGYYFQPGIEPTTLFPNIKCNSGAGGPSTNTNGAIVVNLDRLPYAGSATTPPEPNAYGFIRFRGRVK